MSAVDQVPMFENLEMDNPEGAKKKKKSINCLVEMLTELMNTRGIELVDVQKGSGIAWGTLHGWYKGDVTAQLADENLLKLARYFNVSIEYLCFGIGEEDPAYERFENVYELKKE